MAAVENAESRNEDGRSESGVSSEKVGCDPAKAGRAPRAEKPKKAYEVTILMRRDRYYYDTMTVDAYSAAHAIKQVIDWLIDHTDTDWEDFEFKAVCEKRGRKRK